MDVSDVNTSTSTQRKRCYFKTFSLPRPPDGRGGGGGKDSTLFTAMADALRWVDNALDKYRLYFAENSPGRTLDALYDTLASGGEIGKGADADFFGNKAERCSVAKLRCRSTTWAGELTHDADRGCEANRVDPAPSLPSAFSLASVLADAAPTGGKTCDIKYFSLLMTSRVAGDIASELVPLLD